MSKEASSLLQADRDCLPPTAQLGWRRRRMEKVLKWSGDVPWVSLVMAHSGAEATGLGG